MSLVQSGWVWALLGLMASAAACADPESEDGGTDAADAQALDSGVDAGARDLGVADQGVVDTGLPDLGTTDAGVVDTGFDAGAGAGDAGVDAGPIDTGVDAGPVPTSSISWQPSDGLPDTACPAWTLIDSATPEDPSINGGIMTMSTSANAENMYYHQPGADLILPARLVLEGSARYVSGGSSGLSRAGASMGFRLGPNRVKNILFIEDGTLFLLSNESTRGPSVAMATTDAIHSYRIEAEMVVGGTVEVFRDGVSVLTGATYSDPDTSAPADIFFGEASIVAFGVSEWTSVSHNAHLAVACP